MRPAPVMTLAMSAAEELALGLLEELPPARLDVVVDVAEAAVDDSRAGLRVELVAADVAGAGVHPGLVGVAGGNDHGGDELELVGGVEGLVAWSVSEPVGGSAR